MTPALAALILEFAFKYGIPAARQILSALNTPAPSITDWINAFDAAEVEARRFLAERGPDIVRPVDPTLVTGTDTPADPRPNPEVTG